MVRKCIMIKIAKRVYQSAQFHSGDICIYDLCRVTDKCLMHSVNDVIVLYCLQF